MKPILVTGATGNVGREVVSGLVESGAAVRALTRNPETAGLPAAADVVGGDLTNPADLERVLAGVDSVFLVWTASPEAAPRALDVILDKARRVVLLTSPHQTPHPFFQQPNPLAAFHQALERRIEASPAAWTFLRPGIFAANAIAWWAPQIRAGDVVRWPYGDAPTAPVDERDIAAVAVRALTEDGHDGRGYMLTGPESITQKEQVLTIGEVLGRELRFEEMSPDDARREWAWPRAAIDMLLGAWSAAMGLPPYITGTVEQLTGRAPRTFREWAADRADRFRA